MSMCAREVTLSRRRESLAQVSSGAPDRVTLGSFGLRLAESTTCRQQARESSMAAALKLLLRRHAGQWCATVLLCVPCSSVAMVTTAGESITKAVFSSVARRKRAMISRPGRVSGFHSLRFPFLSSTDTLVCLFIRDACSAEGWWSAWPASRQKTNRRRESHFFAATACGPLTVKTRTGFVRLIFSRNCIICLRCSTV